MSVISISRFYPKMELSQETNEIYYIDNLNSWNDTLNNKRISVKGFPLGVMCQVRGLPLNRLIISQ